MLNSMCHFSCHRPCQKSIAADGCLFGCDANWNGTLICQIEKWIYEIQKRADAKWKRQTPICKWWNQNLLWYVCDAASVWIANYLLAHSKFLQHDQHFALTIIEIAILSLCIWKTRDVDNIFSFQNEYVLQLVTFNCRFHKILFIISKKTNFIIISHQW